MYIPDLFGAYMKGRQQAINDNWQDLKNYEDVERARNVNDQGYMDLWLNRQKLPMEVSMYADKARQSSRDNALADAAFDGLYANSLMGSDYAMLNYNAYSKNRDQISELIRNTLENNLTQRGLANTAKAASNDYFSGLGADGKSRAYNMGTWRAESSYNNADGDNILAGAAPDRARATNAENENTAKLNSVMGQVALSEANHTKSLQPYSQAISNQNTIHSMQDTLNYRNQQLLSLLQEQSSLYDKLSTVTDPATRQVLQSQIAYLQDYMYGMGYTPDTTIPSGAGVSPQATPATGQTQSSVPVGANSVLAPTGTPQTNQSVQDIRSLLPPVLQNPNGGQVYNYPVSPEHGQYRPLVPRQNSVGANGGSGSVVVGGQVIYY